MRIYHLYLESGPKRRKTMVHVLDLLGCTAQGATTEEALEATPQAIHTYLAFLQRHGEDVSPDNPFSITIAEHVMEGHWLGNGDPTPGFSPDFQPLLAEELETYLRRLYWQQDSLLAILRGLSPQDMTAEPQGSGRSIYRILEHIAESHCVYLRYLVGKVDALREALRAVQAGPENVSTALSRLWLISSARLQALDETERRQVIPHGQVNWTARRALRRMLEHNWEHLTEISSRL